VGKGESRPVRRFRKKGEGCEASVKRGSSFAPHNGKRGHRLGRGGSPHEKEGIASIGTGGDCNAGAPERRQIREEKGRRVASRGVECEREVRLMACIGSDTVIRFFSRKKGKALPALRITSFPK